MKKITIIFLTVLCLLSLAACKKKESEEMSSALKDGAYTVKAKGHNGEFDIEVVVEKGELHAVNVGENSETPGIGVPAIETLSKALVETKNVNLDTISGATVTSNALLTAVKEALKQAGATDEYFASLGKASATDALKDSYEYDVVVIGAGGAGLSAAIEAAAAGKRVAILEKAGAAGGNTLVSGGGLNVPNSPQQKNIGVEDSVEQYAADTLKGGDNKADEKLVQVMAEHALEAGMWLMDEIKVEFMSDRVQQFGGHSVPRALIPTGNKGVELINKLTDKAVSLNVDIFYNVKAEEIKLSEGAAHTVVASAGTKTIQFDAKNGVVIASGGFASDVEMRKQYNPNYDERFKSTATQGSTGDGIKMAMAINAATRDLEFIQVYPTCNPNTGIISYVANARFDGAVLVNQEGKRFVNEMGRRDDISNAILDQTNSYAYLLWGQEIESVGKMTEIHKKEFEAWLQDDLIYVAESIEDAAKHYGIDEATLRATIDAYNESITDGKDEDFNKGGKLVPIQEGKFLIQKVTPSTHHTMGGIVINEQAEVIDNDGEVIKGLFAAGEVVGGIHGTNRLGGNAITDIIVFGRIAGKNVAK